MIKLAASAVCYRICRPMGWPMTVQAISLEVTRHCMGRCLMCNIWKNQGQYRDVPLSAWLNLLASPRLQGLIEIDITGGEPFLRRDLTDLIRGIAGLKRTHFKTLAGVAITSNGFLTKRILRESEVMARLLAEVEAELVLVCALDAVGELHDRIRGVKGAWRRLEATVDGLCRLRDRLSNLVLGIKTTILPLNVDQLEAIADYAENLGLFTIISPGIFTPNRYQNLDLKPDLAFSQGQLEIMADFFAGRQLKRSFHGRVVLDYLDQGQVTKPCSAGFNYYFVGSQGQVFPCPLIDLSPGNITQRPFAEVIAAEQMREFRRQIGSWPQCRTCTEPGLERYALPCEGATYLKLMRSMPPDEFSALHQHLGLDKYLGTVWPP